MYTRSMIEKFVADVESTRTIDGAELRGLVTALQFETLRGVEVCMGGAFREILENTSIAYLIDELGRRWFEFATPEEIAWEK